MQPGDPFEVEAYETMDTWTRLDQRTRAVVQWGVVHHVPCCEQMPFRGVEFLWIF